MEENWQKVCCACGESKWVFQDFYRDKKRKDGFYARCKRCHIDGTTRRNEAKRLGICHTCRQPLPSDRS